MPGGALAREQYCTGSYLLVVRAWTQEGAAVCA